MIFGLLSVAGVPKELLGPDIQAAVLQEARAMLEQAQTRCQQLLTSRRDQLDAMAQALLRSEVLRGDELKGLLATGEAPTARSMTGQSTVTVRQRTEPLTDMA